MSPFSPFFRILPSVERASILEGVSIIWNIETAQALAIANVSRKGVLLDMWSAAMVIPKKH